MHIALFLHILVTIKKHLFFEFSTMCGARHWPPFSSLTALCIRIFPPDIGLCMCTNPFNLIKNSPPPPPPPGGPPRLTAYECAVGYSDLNNLTRPGRWNRGTHFFKVCQKIHEIEIDIKNAEFYAGLNTKRWQIFDFFQSLTPVTVALSFYEFWRQNQPELLKLLIITKLHFLNGVSQFIETYISTLTFLFLFWISWLYSWLFPSPPVHGLPPPQCMTPPSHVHDAKA